MACEQSRVWCKDTAPLCNPEGPAQWALSPNQTLTCQDAPRAEVEPAAGRFQGEIQHFHGLDSLEDSLDHSLPEMEMVLGTGPGQAAELACR